MTDDRDRDNVEARMTKMGVVRHSDFGIRHFAYSTGVPISRIRNFMSSQQSFFALGFLSKYAG